MCCNKSENGCFIDSSMLVVIPPTTWRLCDQRPDLAVPQIRLARYIRRSFSVSGLLLLNSLPLTVRDVSLTLTQFFARLKTFLFSRAYGTHHSASVTVSAVKFVCANPNLLAYFLSVCPSVSSISEKVMSRFRPTNRKN